MRVLGEGETLVLIRTGQGPFHCRGLAQVVLLFVIQRGKIKKQCRAGCPTVALQAGISCQEPDLAKGTLQKSIFQLHRLVA